jgi:hypothetical protein
VIDGPAQVFARKTMLSPPAKSEIATAAKEQEKHQDDQNGVHGILQGMVQ